MFTCNNCKKQYVKEFYYKKHILECKEQKPWYHEEAAAAIEATNHMHIPQEAKPVKLPRFSNEYIEQEVMESVFVAELMEGRNRDKMSQIIRTHENNHAMNVNNGKVTTNNITINIIDEDDGSQTCMIYGLPDDPDALSGVIVGLVDAVKALSGQGLTSAAMALDGLVDELKDKNKAILKPFCLEYGKELEASK